MNEPKMAVLSVDAISVAEGFNPRTRFDEKALDALADSLSATDGVVQALAVGPCMDGKYPLVAGERRLRATRKAGIEKLPAVILCGKGAMAASLTENLFRVDLDPIEWANGMKALAEVEGLGTLAPIGICVGDFRSLCA